MHFGAILGIVRRWNQSILYVSFPSPGKFDPIHSFFLSFALLYFNILVPRICHQFAKSHPEIRHEIFKLPAVEHNLSEFIKALTITAVGYDVKIKSIWLKFYFDPIIGNFCLLSTPNLLHALRDWDCRKFGEKVMKPIADEFEMEIGLVTSGKSSLLPHLSNPSHDPSHEILFAGGRFSMHLVTNLMINLSSILVVNLVIHQN